MITVIIFICQSIAICRNYLELSEAGAMKRKQDYGRRKKLDPLVANGIAKVHFMDTQFLSKFITENGKILPRRITGCSARSQRMITRAIKQARNIGLLPL